MKLTGEWVRKEPLALLPEGRFRYAIGVSVNNGHLANCRRCRESLHYNVKLGERLHVCIPEVARAAFRAWDLNQRIGEEWLRIIRDRHRPLPEELQPPPRIFLRGWLHRMEADRDPKEWEQIAWERSQDKR